MGNDLCRKRDAQSSTPSKTPMNRLFGSLQICPNGLNRSDNIQVEKSTNIYQVPSWPTNDNAPVPPPRSSPPKILGPSPALNVEWTEVPLKAPEPPPPNNVIQKKTSASLQQSAVPVPVPVPPPRKHRRGIKQILDRMNSNENRVPVEEPIIVPKKEIIHICDPTKHPHHYHKVDGACGRKSHSTIIPPVYNDLELKKEVMKANRRASIPRNSSLPGDSGMSLSQATAQRLESYMTRCRSFGSLLPQQFMDKIKNSPSTNTANDQSDAESEDSWGGLDDWDLGVIEHDGLQDGPPFVPSSRLPSKKRSVSDVQFIVGTDKSQPTTLPLSVIKNRKVLENIDEPMASVPNATDAVKNARKSGVNFQNMLGVTPSIVVTDEAARRHETLEHPVVKQAPLARRESIEDIVDWFDKEEEETAKRAAKSADKDPTNQAMPLSNVYDMPSNPFRPYQEDSTFHSDAFFTSQFLENEKMANEISDKNIQNKVSDNTGAAASESNNKIQNIIDNKVTDKEQCAKKELNITSNLDNNSPKLTPQKDIYESTNGNVTTDKQATDPINPDDNIEHSSLLKFFKADVETNRKIDGTGRPDRNDVKVDISGFH